LWVPCPYTVILPHQGTHKGCPYDPIFSTPDLSSYQAKVI
jgi:hypothetical protein